MTEQRTERTDALTKKELLQLEHQIKQRVTDMSMKELNDFINKLVDQVLADPGNPIVCESARVAGEIWNSRYGRRK